MLASRATGIATWGPSVNAAYPASRVLLSQNPSGNRIESTVGGDSVSARA
jgi:hypothetical protein